MKVLLLVLLLISCIDKKVEQPLEIVPAATQVEVEPVEELSNCAQRFLEMDRSGIELDSDELLRVGCLSADFDKNGVDDFVVDKTIYTFGKDGKKILSFDLRDYPDKPVLYRSGDKKYNCPATDNIGVVFWGEGATNYIYLYEKGSFKEYSCRSESN